MKRTLIALALVASAPFAVAHELDNEQTTMNADEQMAVAQALPASTVIRTNKKDGRVEIVHLASKLEKGTDVSKLKFEQVALDTEIRGITFTAANELDATSSTSSWRWGWGGGLAYGAGYGYGNGWAGGAVVAGRRRTVAVGVNVNQGYYPSFRVNSWNNGCGNNCWNNNWNNGCGNNCWNNNWNNGCGNNCWNNGCDVGTCGGAAGVGYEVNGWAVGFNRRAVGWNAGWNGGWDNDWDYDCFDNPWY